MPLRAQLRTARLTLRPVSADDRDAIVAGIGDLEVSRWLSEVPYPYAAKDFDHFLTHIARPGETFAVEDETGFCGIIGVEGGELGYWFATAVHGRGYATEAARAVMTAIFAERTEPYVAGYFEGNHRSANVLRKLGFLETGRGLRHCRALGRDRPHVDLILTRSRFLGVGGT